MPTVKIISFLKNIVMFLVGQFAGFYIKKLPARDNHLQLPQSQWCQLVSRIHFIFRIKQGNESNSRPWNTILIEKKKSGCILNWLIPLLKKWDFPSLIFPADSILVKKRKERVELTVATNRPSILRMSAPVI